jgi:hypothetical protein
MANLFSLNRTLLNGLTLNKKGVSICLTKGHVSVTYDRFLCTTNGFFTGMKLLAHPSPVIYRATAKPDGGVRGWIEILLIRVIFNRVYGVIWI